MSLLPGSQELGGPLLWTPVGFVFIYPALLVYFSLLCVYEFLSDGALNYLCALSGASRGSANTCWWLAGSLLGWLTGGEGGKHGSDSSRLPPVMSAQMLGQGALTEESTGFRVLSS